MSVTVHVELPAPLRILAHLRGDVALELPANATQRALIAAIEERYPMLRGTLRDPHTGERRAYLRFFAGGEDISHDGLDAELPCAVLEGKATFLVIGAVSGG